VSVFLDLLPVWRFRQESKPPVLLRPTLIDRPIRE
jgi:hypothetical protein